MRNIQFPRAILPRGGKLRLPQMLALLATLTACAGPVGPVVGDWRGEMPVGATEQIVELVLDGAPGDASGRYQVAITTETSHGGGAGTERWGGIWRQEQAADGQPVFHLLDDLPGSIDRYELGANSVLYPMGTGDRADSSPSAGLYALRPVPPGPGYGRA